MTSINCSLLKTRNGASIGSRNGGIFLHSGDLSRISLKAQNQMENTDLLISPMVLVELEMLYDKGAIRYASPEILSDLSQQIGLSVCQMPMAQVVQSAVTIKWTREPGDLLIVANALANNHAPLVTKDERIRDHYENAIW
jgi:PIN domain nuclease of toxin-antitoxin system